MNGALAIVGKLFALLQQDTGENMVNLIGPISITRGDDLDLVLTVTDDEDAREDITGAAITVTVTQTPGGAALFTKTVGSGVTLRAQAGDTLGQADIAISSANLTAPAGLYWIEVVIVLGGKRQTLVELREFTILQGAAA